MNIISRRINFCHTFEKSNKVLGESDKGLIDFAIEKTGLSLRESGPRESTLVTAVSKVGNP